MSRTNREVKAWMSICSSKRKKKLTSEMDNSNNNTNLNMIYWNPQSIVNKREVLSKILQQTQIFACAESWLSEENPRASNFQYTGFNVYRKDRIQGRGGGILFMVRKYIAYTEVSTPFIDSTVELAGIKITSYSPNINIFVGYHVPGAVLDQDKWDKLFDFIDTNENSLLLGDFNTHHQVWNCSKAESNGERLLETYNNSAQVLHNFNTHTHITPGSGTLSNIDLVFSSANLADRIKAKVNDDTWGSDHFLIFVDIRPEKHFYKKKTFKIKSKRTNWPGVNESLIDNLFKFFTVNYDHLTAVEKYDLFLDVVTSSVKANTPANKFRSAKFHRNLVSWWDSDCDRAIRNLGKPPSKNGISPKISATIYFTKKQNLKLKN